MKNLIYVISPFHNEFSFNTWEYYCKKYNIDLVKNEKLFPLLDIGKNYDKIGLVTHNTMVKWDTENIFNLYNDQFCAVEENSNFEKIINDIKKYQNDFPDINLELSNYFNDNVLFFCNNHLEIIKNYLNRNSSEKPKCTLLNFCISQENPNLKKLSPSYNLYNIGEKDFFSYNWQLNQDQTPFFLKYSKIWNFTSFNKEQRNDLMFKVWGMVKNNYS